VSSSQVYTEAIGQLERLLGNPDVVNAAHQHLARLIRSITLTPDSEAPDALAAEISTDLGALLSGAGYLEAIADRFAHSPQMTARVGATPPTRSRRA
jgi:site-specific DNA recombinase